jgi:hypothetical protein
MVRGEMLFLFGLGIVFAAVFRLTRNVIVLWPFYTPVGGLYTNLSEGLTLPFDATYGFVLTLGLMVAVIVVAGVLYRRRQVTEEDLYDVVGPVVVGIAAGGVGSAVATEATEPSAPPTQDITW